MLWAVFLAACFWFSHLCKLKMYIVMLSLCIWQAVLGASFLFGHFGCKEYDIG